LPQFHDDRLLVGSATADDAGVFKINDELALVQTTDFFTPIVDDPVLYGRIAAANALSDVYAMGGRPITALAIAGMPSDKVDNDTIRSIFQGGAEMCVEAECSLLGGHTIKNPEPIYGLAVTGVVHPDRHLANAHAKPGEHLVLTKPLGSGIVSTGIKRKECSPTLANTASQLMATLNKPGAVLAERPLHYPSCLRKYWISLPPVVFRVAVERTSVTLILSPISRIKSVRVKNSSMQTHRHLEGF